MRCLKNAQSTLAGILLTTACLWMAQWHVRADADAPGKPGGSTSPTDPGDSAEANRDRSKEASSNAEESTVPPKQLFRGRVALLPEALKRRGVRSFAEMKDQVVLETDNGELIPIVSDWRGRALFQDKRLRDRRVELIGRRQEGVPYLQVLMIFVFDEEGVRQYMDYWCDICAIPMYEIKPCDCCQDDIRIRLQPKELPEEFRSDEKPGAPRGK